MILFSCVPFHNGNFSERKEFAPRGNEFFPLKAVPYGMENHFYHIRLPPLNVTIFILHVPMRYVFLQRGLYVNCLA